MRWVELHKRAWIEEARVTKGRVLRLVKLHKGAWIEVDRVT